MYLDNAATTKVHPEVKKAMSQVSFANYNALYYGEAMEAKSQITESIESMATLMKVDKKQLVFTSGASESNNYILKGLYLKYPKGHFITSNREHSCVLSTFKFLKEQGADVTIIQSEDDVIGFSHIEPHIKENTVLVSLMAVNNETGIINDFQGISEELKKREILFHSDITQAVGKIKLDFSLFDYASFSSHKIHGPKGIGVALISKEIKPVPLIHGSGQQDDNRAGTLPNDLIVGLCVAFKMAIENFKVNHERIVRNKEILLQFLKKNLGDDFILNFDCPTVSNIISFRIKNEINQVFLMENSDIIKASTGSSCSIGEPSYVLKAHGFTIEMIQESIRVSTSLYDEVEFD